MVPLSESFNLLNCKMGIWKENQFNHRKALMVGAVSMNENMLLLQTIGTD